MKYPSFLVVKQSRSDRNYSNLRRRHLIRNIRRQCIKKISVKLCTKINLTNFSFGLGRSSIQKDLQLRYQKPFKI